MNCNRITRDHASHDCVNCGYCAWHCKCPKPEMKPVEEAIVKKVGFEFALSAMKAGRRARREGWNGKGMWVGYSPGSSVEPDKIWSLAARKWAAMRALPKEPITVLPYLIMKTADDKIVPWLISQTDVLAEDWEVLQ